jgi:hypothetical protein
VTNLRLDTVLMDGLLQGSQKPGNNLARCGENSTATVRNGAVSDFLL